MSILSRLIALLALLAAVAGLGLRLLFPPGLPPEAATPASTPGLAPPFDVEAFLDLRQRLSADPRLGPGAAFPDPQAAPEPPVDRGIPLLFPPRRFRASVQEGGVRLTWEPHAENPVSGKTFRVTRWQGDGEAVLVGETEGLELLDRVDCEGISYHYHLRAVVRRPLLQDQEAVRESSPATAVVELPRTIRWSALGLEAPERILLRAERAGRPPLGPHLAGPGEEVGNTGWFLEGLRVRETEVLVETRSPRFDGLGRRVIINGLPADRVREAKAMRLLAMVRLSDPCGSLWNLELLLPEGATWPER